MVLDRFDGRDFQMDTYKRYSYTYTVAIGKCRVFKDCSEAARVVTGAALLFRRVSNT